MKTKSFKMLILLVTGSIALLNLGGCKKLSDSPATNGGSNFTWTVNSATFSTYGTGTITSAGGNLHIEGDAMEPDGHTYDLYFNIGPNFWQTGTFTIGDGFNNPNLYIAATYGCPGLGFAYYSDPTHTGTLSITKYDAANQLISGTFSFTAINDADLTTATVTDGSFTNVKWSN